MSYTNSILTHNGRIGKLGEDFACNYLIQNDYNIIDRNFRNKYGEIDIVSHLNGKYYFVEVKTSQSQNVRAEENMHAKKMRKIAKLAEIYVNFKLNSEKFTHETIYAICFIGVSLNPDYTLKEITFLKDLEVY